MTQTRDPKPERGPALRVLGKAMVGTINIVVGGSAAVAAAALHSLPILAVGGAAYAALVAWDFVNPKFFKKALEKEPVSLPSPSALSDLAVREAVEGIMKSRREIERVIDETPAEVMAHLGGVLGSVSAMEEHAARLVRRAEELTEYLERAPIGPIRQEIEKLVWKAGNSRDQEARKQYESAQRLREEQIRALEDIGGARDRIAANLARMVATLEGLPPKIVRMRALDAQAMDALTGSMNEELESINGDMAAFEETLKTLTEVSPV